MREKIINAFSAVLFLSGFMLLFGAAGSFESGAIEWTTFTLESIVGMMLLFGGVGVGGGFNVRL